MFGDCKLTSAFNSPFENRYGIKLSKFPFADKLVFPNDRFHTGIEILSGLNCNKRLVIFRGCGVAVPSYETLDRSSFPDAFTFS